MIAPEEFSPISPDVFNPLWVEAGVTDDQQMREKARRGVMNRVDLWAGAYRLDKPVVIPAVTGLHVEGAGMPADVRSLGWSGRFTALAAGPGNYIEPLVTMNGTAMGRVYRLGLFGHTQPKPRVDDDRSPCLMQFRYVPGYGSADFAVEDVSFFDAEVGIQCGVNEDEPMCEGVQAKRVRFAGVRSCFRSINNQSLCHTFIDPRAEACNTLFDVRRGGSLTSIGGSLTNVEWIIDAGPGGDNVPVCSISDLRAEGWARVRCGQYRTIEINRLSVADAPNNPPQFYVEATSNCVVTFNGGMLRGLQPQCIRVGPYATVVFRNAFMPGFDPAVHLQLLGPKSKVRIKDCTGKRINGSSWGNFLQDYTYQKG